MICSTAYKVPATATVAKESQGVHSKQPLCLPFPFLQVILFYPTARLLSSTALYAASASLNSKFPGQGKMQTATKVILVWTLSGVLYDLLGAFCYIAANDSHTQDS